MNDAVHVDLQENAANIVIDIVAVWHSELGFERLSLFHQLKFNLQSRLDKLRQYNNNIRNYDLLHLIISREP